MGLNSIVVWRRDSIAGGSGAGDELGGRGGDVETRPAEGGRGKSGVSRTLGDCEEASIAGRGFEARDEALQGLSETLEALHGRSALEGFSSVLDGLPGDVVRSNVDGAICRLSPSALGGCIDGRP